MMWHLVQFCGLYEHSGTPSPVGIPCGRLAVTSSLPNVTYRAAVQTPKDQRSLHERLSTPDEIDGGHTPALSRPHELADRLEAYAAEQGLLGDH